MAKKLSIRWYSGDGKYIDKDSVSSITEFNEMHPFAEYQDTTQKLGGKLLAIFRNPDGSIARIYQ